MTDPTPADMLALLSAEDEHTQADWEKSTAAVLRKSGRIGEAESDAVVWDKLARTTLDGIVVPPIGTQANTAAAGIRPTRAGDWDIRAVVAGPSAKAANQAVLADLENGATSLWVQLGRGLEASDLPALLQGVLLDLAPITLDASHDQVDAARALVAAFGDTTPHPLTNLGADPIAARLRGHHVTSDDLVTVARMAKANGVLGVAVDGCALHDLGASDAQELGYALAVGTAYLRQLIDAGLTVDEALGLIEFRFAATDEQFPTIAKLRAARQTWARVAELSGFDLDKLDQRRVQRQHAVTSRPMMSKYDPWVNMLRTTVASFAAGVGGAEAVTVLPFDTPLGVPDAFGRRIARNTSSLLIHESHVAKVTDPAGGSYAVERLTHELAAAGWAEFQQIEAAGGIVAALDDGSLLARVEAVVAVRDAGIARRKRPLTGVSEFPNLGEALPERAADPGADAVRRYGAAFEALRDEPATTPVFLATMGSIAAHTARATFASNLFAAGGIAVEAAGATDGADDVVKAYAGQPVVCLAGADTTYAEWGADVVARLRDAGARWVIVAGKPIDGVDDSCAMGVDALAFLHRTREKLA
jgi:methylmalonyl-CoA mutase